MIAVKKETLEDSLTRILWYYLNNDFNLNMVARELLSRESAALALQAGQVFKKRCLPLKELYRC